MDGDIMVVSTTLNTSIQTMRQMLAKHPFHQLDMTARMDFYSLLDGVDTVPPYAVRSWLAILSAERVLPSFTAVFPTISIPRRAVRLAISIVQGKYTSQSPRVRVYTELAYHASGNHWGHVEQTVPWYSHLAGLAACKTLYEICGSPPFSHFQHLETIDTPMKAHLSWSDHHITSDHRWVDIQEHLTLLLEKDSSDSGKQIEALLLTLPVDHIHRDSFSSDTLELSTRTSLPEHLHIADLLPYATLGDGAGAAALSYAYNHVSRNFDQERLYAFWEWWLTEAIAEAWKHAHSS